MPPTVQLLLGDCRDQLKTLADSSVDSVVTDPPYELGFMGKAWDNTGIAYDVDMWRAVLRVLKPGGHLLAFGGTRTYHRMACAIEDAGFEIRDQMQWLYGCLSEDTELLVDGQWEPYRNAIAGRRALCYDVDSNAFAWLPIQHLHVYDYDDTAFHLHSERTDQLVSRQHRCLVERDGRLVFERADALQREETVPIVEDVRAVLDAVPMPESCAGDPQPILHEGVRRCTSLGDTEGSLQDTSVDVPGMQEGVSLGEQEGKASAEVLLTSVLRSSEGAGHRNRCSSSCDCSERSCGMDGCESCLCEGEDVRHEQPRMEGWRDVLPQARELQADQVRSVPVTVSGHGTKGRLRDGAQALCSAGCRATSDASGVSTSCEPRSAGQPPRQPDALPDESGSQAVRSARLTTPDLVRVEPVAYRGVVWCVTVPTGAFVARRNGKVFVTGNSGFPKSLDVSKALDRMAGAEREVVGRHIQSRQDRKPGHALEGSKDGSLAWQHDITAPATPEPQAWQGWGTALKPANEPICVARKPLSESTVAKNVLAHRTGAINIDGCRIGTTVDSWPVSRSYAPGQIQPGGRGATQATGAAPPGRWPANVVLSHVDPDEHGNGGCRMVGTKMVKSGTAYETSGTRDSMNVPYVSKKMLGRVCLSADPSGKEEVEAWACVDGCAVKTLDEQSGRSVSTDRPRHNRGENNGVAMQRGSETWTSGGHKDAGGASRFFKTIEPEGTRFLYQAKASRSERNAGLEGFEEVSAASVTGRADGSPGLVMEGGKANPYAGTTGALRRNTHSTVKPVKLMEYLVRLITPPGGTVLDPFLGSGTTGVAAAHEGFSFIGIEREAEYMAICEARIAHAQQEKDGEQPPLPLAA